MLLLRCLPALTLVTCHVHDHSIVGFVRLPWHHSCMQALTPIPKAAIGGKVLLTIQSI